MNIFYMNDENKNIVVQINGQLRPSATNPYGEPSIEYVTLAPQESRVFYVDAPDKAIPYVKKWDAKVLLSYLPHEAVSQYRQS